MAYGILHLDAIQATNIDALNRSAKGSADLENGNIVRLLTKSTAAGEDEVWVATQPAASAGLQNLWMVADDVYVRTYSGSNVFLNIDNDPRNFIVKSGKVFKAFKPQVGDILTLSADALAGEKGSNGYVVATASTYDLTWAAAAVSGLSLKLIATNYISIPSGTLGDTQRVVSYQFEVVAIA